MANTEIVFKVNANPDYPLRMPEVLAAESRAQLNRVWVKNNALLEMNDGTIKLVERVTMTRGEPYEIVARSNFYLSDRAERVADEFRCKISDLTSGSANDVKSVCFGFFGVPFPAARKVEEVVDTHASEGSIIEFSVLSWSGQGGRPALATAQRVNAEVFLERAKMKAIGKIRKSEPLIDVGKMTSVAQVLDASGLGRDDRLSASAARLFLEGV
jgi:hypothetical protein